MTEIHDIAVVGGGIVGASLLHFLDGARSVILLEQEAAVGYHSTGRSAAEFTRRFHSEPIGRLTSASAAFMMSPPTGFSEADLLRPRGNLIVADAEKADRLMALFHQEQAAGPAAASPVELIEIDGALEKCPILDPNWLKAAFFDPDCWDVEVESLLQGYLRSAKAKGAAVRQSCQVIAALREGDHWLIETTQGALRARCVVNAAGAWADSVAQLFRARPLGLTPHRRTAISVEVPGHDVGAMSEVCEVDELFYFKPDAGKLMVSPADETPVDAHDVRPEELDIAYAAHYIGEVTTLDVRHIAHSWAGLRTFASDRLPVIGASQEVEGFFWLAGLGGAGIQTSPAVGQIAAALLRATPLPDNLCQAGVDVTAFSPDRF
ncbi:MAG: glycerol-3-phosphate dehydrogenase [Roseovarius sp.]|nr:glycerol-3-phosphate dehydrogenase [Roseovarius sp.]MAZ22003.1 glycerol-3-phosphate dehydrogenase [Roseovarius sp.]